jgi:hypothetical protein
MVIDVLRAAGARLVLVGIVSDRYEFRTERAIQELYAGGPDEVVRLSEAEAPAFGRLDEAPVHPLPLVPALFHALQQAIASAAAARGARVVVSGVGGDALFCDGFDGDAERALPFSHHGWGVYDPWPNDHVYGPRGMRYVSGFAVWPIAHLVWALRRGQPEDVQKRFARRLFEGRLPRELTHFAYKADHGGAFHDGLAAAVPSIREVARTAFELTRRAELHPNRLVADARRSVHLDDPATRRLLLSLAFATWAHALVREGLA